MIGEILIFCAVIIIIVGRDELSSELFRVMDILLSDSSFSGFEDILNCLLVLSNLVLSCDGLFRAALKFQCWLILRLLWARSWPPNCRVFCLWATYSLPCGGLVLMSLGLRRIRSWDADKMISWVRPRTRNRSERDLFIVLKITSRGSWSVAIVSIEKIIQCALVYILFSLPSELFGQ